MRYALIVLAVVLCVSLVVAQDGSPGASNAPGAVVKQETVNKVGGKTQVGSNAGKCLSQPQAVIAACNAGEKVVRERNVVRNYHQTVVVPGNDEAARQLARSADRDAKGDYACGGDGRVEGLMKKWGVVSKSYVDARDNLVVQTMTTRTAGQGGRKMSEVGWLIFTGMILTAIGIIAYVTRGTRASDLVWELRQAYQRLTGTERVRFSGSGNKFEYTIEPANPTPVIPPAPVPGQGSPVGIALVPVSFAPVTLTLGAQSTAPPVPVTIVAPPAPPAPAPAAPAAASPPQPAPAARPRPAPAPGAGAPPAPAPAIT